MSFYKPKTVQEAVRLLNNQKNAEGFNLRFIQKFPKEFKLRKHSLLAFIANHADHRSDEYAMAMRELEAFVR